MKKKKTALKPFNKLLFDLFKAELSASDYSSIEKLQKEVFIKTYLQFLQRNKLKVQPWNLSNTRNYLTSLKEYGELNLKSMERFQNSLMEFYQFLDKTIKKPKQSKS
jgi:hypothetical protein